MRLSAQHQTQLIQLFSRPHHHHHIIQVQNHIRRGGVHKLAVFDARDIGVRQSVWVHLADGLSIHVGVGNAELLHLQCGFFSVLLRQPILLFFFDIPA